MKFLRPLAALISAATVSVAPALASIDPYTPALLQTVRRHGAKVLLNPPVCDGRFLGSYNSLHQELTVCYTKPTTARDHDTVRHEAFHHAQSCAADRNGHGHQVMPILTGPALRSFVTNVLSDDQIVDIKGNYPKHMWLSEMEAFAAAQHYSSEQMARIVEINCS